MINSDQQYTIATIGDNRVVSFDYVPTSIMGVGRSRPAFINMDDYINHDLDDDLHQEALEGLALADDQRLGGLLFGSLLTSELQQSWTEVLKKLAEEGVDEKHINAFKRITKESDPTLVNTNLHKYTCFALGAAVPWFFTLHLKTQKTFGKTPWGVGGELTKSAKLFPKIMSYVETLPFKNVSRILFFTTYPNANIVTHRDGIFEEHKNHMINLYFSGGPRKTFCLDTKTNEKVYLDKNARSYCFNNRDYHGVDADSVFRYTLRVEGVFTDELQEKLQLDDGYIWKWDYGSI